MPNESPMPILLKSIGIDKHSFERFVSWALSEHLVGSLSSLPQIKDSDLFNQLDALKQFRNILKRHTTRDWSAHDVNALFERVKEQLKVHYRKPIEYGEYLKLLWQVPLECATCKKNATRCFAACRSHCPCIKRRLLSERKFAISLCHA